MKCPVCHYENNDSNKFCVNCGAKLEPVQPQDQPAPAESDNKTVNTAEAEEKQTLQPEPVQEEVTVQTVVEDEQSEKETSNSESVVDLISQQAESEKKQRAQKQWYYAQNGNAQGPYDEDFFRQLITSEIIGPNTYIWSPGMADWVYTQNSELASLLPEHHEPLRTPQPEPEVEHATVQEPEREEEQEPAREVEWHYVAGNHSEGPYITSLMKRMLANGTINADTYVYRDGFNDWEKVSDTELAQYLPKNTQVPPANNYYNRHFTAVQTRSTALYVILSILTCGIWYLVWMYQAADSVNRLCDERHQPRGIDPVLAVLLSIVTCGIYSIYYFYKECSVMATIDVAGRPAQNNTLLCTLLSVFGLGIVSIAILQESINDAVKYGS